MALDSPYATYAEYIADVGSTNDTGTNTAIESDLKAVSRWIDRKLDRFFNIDAAPVARVYVVPIQRSNPPYGWAESENPFRWGFSRALDVDDIATTNGLAIKIDVARDGSFTDDTALASTDYELFPINAPLGPEPRPYTRIVIPEWSQQGGFGAGARVQVTAYFGWPTVPPAIKRATIDITRTLRTGLSQGEAKADGVKRMSVSGGLAVDYGGTTEAAASAHQELVNSLMREYGRARRFFNRG